MRRQGSYSRERRTLRSGSSGLIFFNRLYFNVKIMGPVYAGKEENIWCPLSFQPIGDGRDWMPQPRSATYLENNRCLTCGACCAFYRVAFLSVEVDDHEGGKVPLAFVLSIDDTHSAMKGTHGFFKRCAALQGSVGRCVTCAIYSSRPSTCRNFLPGWDVHYQNDACNQARSAFGLPSFTDY